MCYGIRYRTQSRFRTESHSVQKLSTARKLPSVRSTEPTRKRRSARKVSRTDWTTPKRAAIVNFTTILSIIAARCPTLIPFGPSADSNTQIPQFDFWLLDSRSRKPFRAFLIPSRKYQNVILGHHFDVLQHPMQDLCTIHATHNYQLAI
jgi:hypothetical protein